MKETKWTAIYMPATDGDDPTKSGFETEDTAWEYVESFNCEDCKEDGFSSACAAEWDVLTDEDWNSYKEEE